MHFSSVVWNLKKGKLMYTCWALLVGFGLLGAYQKRRYREELRKFRELSQNKNDVQVKHVKRRGFLNQLIPLLKISFPKLVSRSTAHLAGYTALLCARIVLTIKIAQVTGALGRVNIISFLTSILSVESDKFIFLRLLVLVLLIKCSNYKQFLGCGACQPLSSMPFYIMKIAV